jgi:hypothetical protein
MTIALIAREALLLLLNAVDQAAPNSPAFVVCDWPWNPRLDEYVIRDHRTPAHISVVDGRDSFTVRFACQTKDGPRLIGCEIAPFAPDYSQLTDDDVDTLSERYLRPAIGQMVSQAIAAQALTLAPA